MDRYSVGHGVGCVLSESSDLSFPSGHGESVRYEVCMTTSDTDGVRPFSILGIIF